MSKWEQFVFVIEQLPWVLGFWQYPLVLVALILVFLYIRWVDS